METTELAEASQVVLVVSPDRATRALVAALVAEMGFGIVESDDASAALDLATAHSPSLVVVDIGGDVPGGLPLCLTVRGTPGLARVPILALADQDDTETTADVFEAGVTDCAPKPLRRTVLSYRIRHLLRAEASLDDLRRSEEVLETAQRIARLGNWEWDLNTGKVNWSEGVHRLLGSPRNRSDPTFQDFLASVHPDDSAAVATALESSLRGEKSFELDHRVVRPDGTVLVVHSHAEVRWDPRGQPVRMAGTMQDVTERKQSESQIRRLAFYDNLTGLPNRVHFNELVKRSLLSARERTRMAAVMFLDLDNFKRINDTAGHSAGDALLRSSAERLQEVLRPSDVVSRAGTRQPAGTVARLGGDEFVVLLPNLVKAEDAGKIASRLLEAFKPPFEIDGHEIQVSTSIGISIFPQDGNEAEDLLKHADAALYHAKDSGRNNFQFYSAALNDAAFRRLALESNLRKAVDRGELVLHYQPQVNARDGRLVGVEALVRWNHPDLGLVYPGQFIPLAEETGLIRSIDEWVLREACRQNATWQKAGLSKIHVAVNLSGYQFRRGDLLEKIDAAMQDSGLEPRHVELEITEGVLMENAAQTLEILNGLRARGFKIAVDDFGTGYSSLAYLRRFRAEKLKIDRSFVREIATNPDDAAIVGAIVTLAETLKMTPIAEGIESPVQREFLYDLGCELMQGYLFGRPTTAEAITELLRIDTARGDAVAAEPVPATAAPA